MPSSKLAPAILLSGLLMFAPSCASPERTKVSLPPAAGNMTPKTIFGEASLMSGGNPAAPLNIPATPERALTLEECLSMAARVNPTLDSADQAHVGAMWGRWEAITAFLPTASTSYSATKYNNLERTGRANSPKLDGGRFKGTTQYSWQTQVQQSVFAGGRNRANYLLSKLGVSAAKIQRIQVQEDLSLMVKQAYYNILATEKALDVAKTAVANLDSHLNVAKNFYEVGMVPKNQVLEAEVELAQAVQNETDLARDLTVARARMNILLRQEVDKPIKVVDTLKYTNFPLSMAECMQMSLAESPEIQLGRYQVEMSSKGVDAARSGYYPQVGLTYTNSSSGNTSRAHGGWSNDDSGWAVATVASFNFWEWGRTKAQVEKSKVDLNRSVNSLTALEDNAKLEVTSNYQNLISAGKNIDVSAKAVVSATEDLRMVRERYMEQVATNTEVMDAQTRYSNAQYDHYQSLYNYNLAWATLERTLGRQVLPGGLKPITTAYIP